MNRSTLPLAIVAITLAMTGCGPASELAPSSTAVGRSAESGADPSGTAVGEVDGVLLDAASAGDGDGQGDALVAGTPYHATAQVRCEGYQGAAPGLCDAGVVRGLETGPYVEVQLPDDRKRTIFFNPDGSFLTFSTAEADGTAAMATESRREGDTTIAMLGTERYEIPAAFVLGD